MLKKFVVLAAVMTMMASLVLTASPASAQDDGMDDLPSIAGLVEEAAMADEAEFTVLNSLLDFTETRSTLDTVGPLTVFAPTDAAFNAALEDMGMTPEELLTEENQELVTEILLYHVVPGHFNAETLSGLDGESLATGYWGSSLDVSTDTADVMLDDAAVLQADIHASNGLVHVIDAVLMPSEDEGTELRSLQEGDPSLVDLVMGEPTYSTLVTAVLSSPEATEIATSGIPVTVFAPDDDAFASALSEMGLTADELLVSDSLTSILAYHIVPWPFFAEDLAELDGVLLGTFVQEQSILVEADEEGNVLVGGVMVVSADTMAADGVIHTINSVLVPEEDEGDMDGMEDDMDDMGEDDMGDDSMDDDSMDDSEDDMSDDDMEDDGDDDMGDDGDDMGDDS